MNQNLSPSMTPEDVARAVQCSKRAAFKLMRKAGAVGEPPRISERALLDWFNAQTDEILRKRAEEELWPEDLMRILKCSRPEAIGVIAVAGGFLRGDSARKNPIARAALDRWLKTDLSMRFVSPVSAEWRHTYVYFIASGSSVKIGYTKKIEQRVAAVQMLSPSPVRALALLKGSAQLERALHARFSEYRIHGEWFRNKGKLAALLAKAPR